MTEVWSGSGLDKGLTMSSKSGVRSHISRLSSGFSERTTFSLSGSGSAVTGVLCVKGGSGSAARIHTEEKEQVRHRMIKWN